MAHLRAHAAKDPIHPSNAIFGTVDMDRIGFQAPYSFHMELDSGSQCMAITRTIFNTAFPNDILCRPPLTLHNFDGSLITNIESYFMSEARFNGQMCPVNVYMLDNT